MLKGNHCSRDSIPYTLMQAHAGLRETLCEGVLPAREGAGACAQVTCVFRSSQSEEQITARRSVLMLHPRAVIVTEGEDGDHDRSTAARESR